MVLKLFLPEVNMKSPHWALQNIVVNVSHTQLLKRYQWAFENLDIHPEVNKTQFAFLLFHYSFNFISWVLPLFFNENEFIKGWLTQLSHQCFVLLNVNVFGYVFIISKQSSFCICWDFFDYFLVLFPLFLRTQC